MTESTPQLSAAQRASLERMSKLLLVAPRRRTLLDLGSDVLEMVVRHLDWRDCCALLATSKAVGADAQAGPALRARVPFARIRVLDGDTRYRILGGNGEREGVAYSDPAALFGATYHYTADGVRYIDMKREVDVYVDYVVKVKRDAPLIRNLRIQDQPGVDLPRQVAFERGPGVPDDHAATPEFQKQVDAAHAKYVAANQAYEDFLAPHNSQSPSTAIPAALLAQSQRHYDALVAAFKAVPSGSLPPDHWRTRGPPDGHDPVWGFSQRRQRQRDGWMRHEGGGRHAEPLDPEWEYRRVPLPCWHSSSHPHRGSMQCKIELCHAATGTPVAPVRNADGEEVLPLAPRKFTSLDFTMPRPRMAHCMKRLSDDEHGVLPGVAHVKVFGAGHSTTAKAFRGAPTRSKERRNPTHEEYTLRVCGIGKTPSGHALSIRATSEPFRVVSNRRTLHKQLKYQAPPRAYAQ